MQTHSNFKLLNLTLKFNESPENAAFVGHAKIEIDGAKAIGLTTIIFNPDPDCKEADFKIEKFNDLLKIPPIENSE